MALKRGIRQLKMAKSCGRKIRHETLPAARSAAARTGDGSRAYRCLHCGGFHVGRPPGGRG